VGIVSHNIVDNLGLPLYLFGFVIVSILISKLVLKLANCCCKGEAFINGVMKSLNRYQDVFLTNALAVFFMEAML
jgi:hypothetical protein